MVPRSFNRSLRDDEADDDDALSITVRTGRASKSSSMGARLQARIKRMPGTSGVRSSAPKTTPSDYAIDPRQRVIVKVHYYKHGGGGAAALAAHGAYIAREGARLEGKLEPHADYLSRDGARGFYDAAQGGVDGRDLLGEWGRSDSRHFRIILSPENGQAIADLTGYTREVMARAEAELGRPLQWVAVNHWDTDNPHTHIVLRGRDADGARLSLPDNFIKHSFREIARDVASERLGPRTPDDERRAQNREVRAPRLTRFDKAIAEKLDPAGKVRMAELGTGMADPGFAASLKARVVELSRMGLAQEIKRGVFAFAPDWQARLRALELHADIRRNRFAIARGDKANDQATKGDRRQFRETPGNAGKRQETGEAFEKAAKALSADAGKPYRELGSKTQRWTVRGEVDLPAGKHFALERHDRVTLAPMPPGLDVDTGQKVMAGMKDGVAQVMRAVGIDR
ncbi:MAG: relaxase/mobilization nuclease domain-containing protein [Caulobacterales bacterium]